MKTGARRRRPRDQRLEGEGAKEQREARKRQEGFSPQGSEGVRHCQPTYVRLLAPVCRPLFSYPREISTGVGACVSETKFPRKCLPPQRPDFSFHFYFIIILFPSSFLFLNADDYPSQFVKVLIRCNFGLERILFIALGTDCLINRLSNTA